VQPLKSTWYSWACHDNELFHFQKCWLILGENKLVRRSQQFYVIFFQDQSIYKMLKWSINFFQQEQPVSKLFNSIICTLTTKTSTSYWS